MLDAACELAVQESTPGSCNVNTSLKGERRKRRVLTGSFSRGLQSTRLRRELEERLAAEENRDKLVTVVLKRVEDHLEILVSDCGSGFDYESYLAFDRERIFHSHGRGVLLARGPARDRVLHPGNRVRAGNTSGVVSARAAQ